MSLMEKPELTVDVMAYPAVNLGSKQLVRIRVRGWGRLTIRGPKLPFHAYFFEDTEWALQLPNAVTIAIEARNIFGKAVVTLSETSPRPFLSDQEFFEKLQPKFKQIPSPVIKALPVPAVAKARIRIRSDRVRGNRIRTGLARLAGAIRLPRAGILLRRHAIKLPRTLIRDNIRPVYKEKQIRLRIKSEGLDLSHVFETIKKEMPREHR